MRLHLLLVTVVVTALFLEESNGFFFWFHRRRNRRNRPSGVKPSCGGKKCHMKATCYKHRCICRKGYYGDGVNECNQQCVCTASGDPHYHTYDGQWIHFQGICKYLLTAHYDNTNPCWFSVAVKNENRGSKRVSYTKLVQIQLPGANIVLRKKNSGREVTINDEKVCLPYTKKGQFKVFRSGINVRVETCCHITVSWNGQGTVSVAVPKKYKNQLLGICGNCNGHKDDYKTKDGTVVSGASNKYDLIGKSWELDDDTGIQQCTSPEKPIPCTNNARRKAESMNACGMINPKNKMKSPFKACIEADPAAAKELYNNCVFDYCSFYTKPASKLADAICKALEGFSDACENCGYGASWRRQDLCPLQCGKHMVYSPTVSGCPATCVDQHAPSNCDLPETEGCECKAGYILSDDQCVKTKECGCRDSSGRYFPLGSKYTTSTCSVQECIVQNGKPILRTDSTKKCGSHATCRLSMGSYQCVCDEGYIKQGSTCIRKPAPPAPPPPEDDCRKTHDGLNYNGKVSSTASGLTCQAWSSQSPHRHRFPHLPKNYCRNPDASARPWCYTTNPKKRYEYCNIPFCEPTNGPIEGCLADAQGINYEGHKSVTASGLTCQNWDSNHPHKHRFTSSMKTEANYCRNPDGHSAPWCYTTDPNKRWEACAIPECAKCNVEIEAGQSCELIYKMSGSCHYKSHSRSNCKYIITLEKESGKAVAKVEVKAKTHTLKEGQSINDCAHFKLKASTLIVRDRICSDICNNRLSK